MNQAIYEELIKSNNFISEEKFERIIETNRHNYDGSYIDAIIHYYEENDIDLEDVKLLLTDSLLLKIKNEAIEKNLLKESTLTRKTYLNLEQIFP